MSPPLSLTGCWVGHFLQHGQSRAIIATLHQADDRLSGTMQDVRTDGEYSLLQLAAEVGLPPGADEKIEAKLRGLAPDTPPRTVRCVWRLPSDSILEGRLSGRKVSFLKSYQGKSLSGFRIGNEVLGREYEGIPFITKASLRLMATALKGSGGLKPGRKTVS
jgi:hypothetical protein